MTYKPKQLSLTGKKGGPKKIASLNDAYIKEHYSGDSSLPERPKKPTLPKIRLPGGLERQKTDAPSGKGKIFSYSTPGNKVYEGKKWNPTNKKGGTKTTLKSLSKGTKKFKQTQNYKNTIQSILSKKKKEVKPEVKPKESTLGPVLGKSKPKDYIESLKQFGRTRPQSTLPEIKIKKKYQADSSLSPDDWKRLQKKNNKPVPIPKVPKTIAQLVEERFKRAGTGKADPSIEMIPKYGKIKS